MASIGLSLNKLLFSANSLIALICKARDKVRNRTITVLATTWSLASPPMWARAKQRKKKKN